MRDTAGYILYRSILIVVHIDLHQPFYLAQKFGQNEHYIWHLHIQGSQPYDSSRLI